MKNINPKNILIILVLLMMAQTTNAQSQLWGLTNKGGHQFGTIFSIAPGATTLTNQIDLPGVAGQSSNFISLVQASDGNLYGMTPGGGVFGSGLIFKYDPIADTYVETINMNANTGDLPYGSLTRATDNMLYGMTSSGGSNNVGVIFQYDPTTNAYTKMIDLEDATGSQPQGSLIQAGNGKLYGMTYSGGAFGSGVLFEYNPTNNTYTDLFDFNGSAGTFPMGNLIQASDNMLYGMTSSGGGNADGYNNGQQGYGVLFQYDIINATYTKKTDLSNATGIWPTGSLYQASDGFLYGMTNYGGSVAGGYVNGGHGYGVIFKYDINSDTYTDIVNLTSADGSNPYGSFIQGSDGNLYAMTNSGGTNNVGTIFQFNPSSSSYTKKIDMTSSTGSFPQGSLMEASDGKLYGLANHGGSVFSAVVFQYDPTTNNYIDKKHISYSDGSNPQGSLIMANDGKLYGLTSSGGAFGNGVLFQFDPVTMVYTDKIDLTDPTGDYPYGSLIQASDGYLYGMNNYGGANSAGVIFQYDPVNNIYTDIFDFSDGSGDYPDGNLIQGSDGMLYGMTSYGGANYGGVIFKFDPTTFSFTDVKDLSDETGNYPYGSLIQASDGKMYGMTSYGGSNYAGSIFSFDPNNNNYTLLHSCSDGIGDYPSGSLIQARDGNFYGMTSSGGAYGSGVIFQYNLSSGTYTDLVDLMDATGDYPNGSLMQSINGNLYGTMSYGGTNGAGVVFEYNLQTGIYSDIYNFNYLDGFNPQFGNLIEICTPPDQPVLSLSANPICSGGSETLTVTGNLNCATGWKWYTGSCGGTLIGTGASIVVNPTTTTTYYAKADGVCVTSTSCASVTVVVNSNPFPTITGNNSFCSGSNLDLSVSSYTSVLWNNNSTNTTLNINTASTYSVTVTDISTGCTGTASKDIIENSLPTAIITGSNVGCGSINLTSSGGVSYLWNGGANTNNSSNTFTASGNYFVIVTDNNGCTAIASQAITVNPNPIASISGNSTGCSSVSLSVSGGTSYSWNGGNNPNSSANTFNNSGDYSIIVTDANGCTGSASSSVTIFPLPSVSINNINNSCSNDATITLTGTPSGGVYSGNGVNGSIFSPAAAGIGSSAITYSYTDGNGCSSNASTTATVNPNPIPQITSGVSSICSGSNAVLQVLGNYSSYLWNNGNQTNAITVNDSGSFVVTVTNSFGCTGTTSQHISVIPSPTAFIATSNGSSICAGNTTELDAGHFDSYLWSNGSTNEFVDVTANGTFTVTVTDVDGCTGVSTPKTIVVNNNPVPTISANGATSFCQGGSVNLCSGQSYSTYNWGTLGASSCISVNTTGTYVLTVTDNHGCTGIASQSVTVNAPSSVSISTFSNVSCSGSNNGSATAIVTGGSSPYTYSWNTNPIATNATASNLAPGTYNVIVTTANGCTSSASKSIVLTPDVTVPVITANSTINVSAPSSGTTVTVNLTPPTVTDNCGVASITSNHPSALFGIGTTTVIWTATDISGNTTTSSQIVIVANSQPPSITPNSPVVTTTTTGSAFATITLSTPTVFASAGIASVVNNHPSTQFPVGITTVLWTATDVAGKTATSSQTVTVYDTQAPIVLTKNISVTLSNGIATITATMVDNGSYDNCGVASESVYPYTFRCNNIGANTVTLTVTDIHSNTASATCTVTVIGAIPSRTITTTPANNTYTGGDPTKIYLGYGPQSATLNGTCSGGSSFSSSWSGDDGLSSRNTLYPTFAPTQEGSFQYTVTTTNNYGCSSTTTASYCVKDIRASGNGNAGKVYICHEPNGNHNNWQALSISASAVGAHLSNHPGDGLAICGHECGEDDRNINIKIYTEADLKVLNSTLKLDIMPNPAANTSTVYFNAKQNQNYVISISDNTGRIISQRPGTAQDGTNSVVLDISTLAQGFYLVSLQTDDGTFKAKLIKE